jgi:hypothetical protein
MNFEQSLAENKNLVAFFVVFVKTLVTLQEISLTQDMCGDDIKKAKKS